MYCSKRRIQILSSIIRYGSVLKASSFTGHPRLKSVILTLGKLSSQFKTSPRKTPSLKYPKQNGLEAQAVYRASFVSTKL
jgi:hypothetical protein